MKHLFTTALLIASSVVFGQNKKDQDRAAILKMEGCYKVTFSFAETFSPNKNYEYHNDRKYEDAIEYVKVVENTENKVVLQHLLIVNDTMIIKHWRQDWLFENTALLVYDKKVDKKEMWYNITIPAEKAKGTWTQKVFQVDDSPRYEGYGTWVHVDGRSFWESKADAPLPRREHTKRDDYNVTGRFSHIEIFNDGWVLEQDNDKVLREADKKDVLIAQEKGIERFWVGDYNCKAAIEYWDKQQEFWKIAREVWTEKLAKGAIDIELFKNGNVIYMRFFELSNETAKAKKIDAKKVRSSIQTIIDEHVTIK
jgi:hypothetical protein